MPWYRKAGKIAEPLTEEAFRKGIESGHFCRENHRAYAVLLWYSAVRKTEALRVVKEQFTFTSRFLYFEVGERLKKQKAWLKKTEPLPLSRSAPFMDVLERAIQKTRDKKRVFDFSPRTAYNVVSRVWAYPHLFRLSRITWFFEQKEPSYSIAQVRSWTGLSLRALEYYIGLVKLREMGEGLAGSG